MSTLIDLITENIIAHPQRCAAKCGDDRISYGELGKNVDSFASYLSAQNYDHNALVAVMMERSLDMLVALLGIMKAGHGYLPIDPSFPAERISYMLEHSQVNAVVADKTTINSTGYSEVVLPSALNFIDLAAVLQQQSGAHHSTKNHARGSDLAYVIYTSGSTGLPKGVMIPHRAVYNLLTSMAKRPGLRAEDTLAAVTTLSFDISVLELFLPICVGGCVEIVSKSVASDGEQLAALLAREPITVMQATPSTWKMLQDTGWQGQKTLKVFVGGEAPPRDVIEKLIVQCGEVWNMYGPTETTVWSSCFNINNANAITIGEAIDNTQFYVLGEDMQPVPEASEGLLYIGGKGLARGYLFRDDLTDERFVDHINEPGEKIYNTGDVVFRNGNGSIEYRRRADNQIKLRGFRIELGEIESRLNRIDGIFQSVVTVSDVKSESELVAYLTTTDDATLTVTQIRSDLSQYLPNYMLPNRFLLLDEMPLTPNGKVDRNNLPTLADAQPLDQADYLAPRDAMEALIAEIWREVLGLKKISVNADFYELGGHSLLITRIWARLKTRFGCALQLDQVFRSATIAELAVEMRNYSENQEGHLAIPVVSRMKAPAMSIAQQRFWYIDQVAPHESLYNLCSAFTFKGILSIELLEECLNRIIQRHEILRTALDWTGDLPKQIIAKQIHFQLPVEDLSGIPEPEREQALTRRLGEKIQEKIPLDSAPLFKACLLIMEGQRHVLFFMPHHVIWDGWSFDIFLHEMKSCYEALSEGAEPQLTELPIQYADFAQWHHQYLAGDSLNSQLDYWNSQLGGEIPVLDLPVDHVRPSLFSYNGESEAIEFEAELVAGINALAKDSATTVNVVLMTIYFILLFRYTRQDDIIIGSPIQGRLTTESENMIGLFVNTLPIRVRLQHSLSFSELIERVKQAAVDAYQNQEVPFERLVEDMVLERDNSRTPIFQTLFTFQEVSEREYQIGNMELQQINVHNGTCPVDISFWVKSSPTSLVGAVEYNPDLFLRERICRLVGHIKKLTSSVLANPLLAIDNLEILTTMEQSRLLLDYNRTDKTYVHYDSVPRLFEQQVKRYPQKVAVSTQSAELCYQALDQLSNQVAHKLLSCGLKPGQKIAVCIERDVNLPVVLLAIWKCGAAYIPIDSALPEDRISYIFEHSKASLLVTQRAFADQYETFDNKLVIDEIGYQDQPTTPPDGTINPQFPAYIIYTSGSTGLPKGVVVQHSNVLNFLQSMAEYPGVGCEDRMLAVTTLSFDIHVLEVWLPLVVGASVVILDAERAGDGLQIADILEEKDITVMQATPSTWKLLQACDWTGKANLKGLIGGEASGPDLIEFLQPKLESLWNMYGPTETTVWSTCHRVIMEDEQLLIGKPIANTQVYVLDDSLQLVPESIEGELYIGGSGVTLGYLYDEEKTSSTFVDLVLSDNVTRHLYKTGDLVVFHSNGQLQYSRRTDNQVKVRGYRIELGEIETALNTLEQVDDVVVIVREDMPGDKRIVAYYVPTQRASLTITEMRRILRDKLPVYMVPQYLVSLDRLPLTPNGKLDRKMLPAPYILHAGSNEESSRPQTESEKLIAEKWQTLIGCQRAGRDDNFFELGGHSLLSMSFINDVRKSIGALLTPRDLVLNDLAQLALSIDQQTGGSSSKDIESAAKSNKSALGRMIDRFR